MKIAKKIHASAVDLPFRSLNTKREIVCTTSITDMWPETRLRKALRLDPYHRLWAWLHAFTRMQCFEKLKLYAIERLTSMLKIGM